ncbi:hypothetical protein CERZMDRAFT_84582 [Cercospora zeae-maydis SCOH1-5]|uniref:Uncharacterized protein n=1 Tax=Cercospora zeae-maydis SCOH1-5 TaxID=717836 RepID=A0A6A6FFI4_9PEZI|nr:hypothetical protein CERZMDRAFT_84582 [Cercospora zeae-maydis SCOH1-5]
MTRRRERPMLSVSARPSVPATTSGVAIGEPHPLTATVPVRTSLSSPMHSSRCIVGRVLYMARYSTCTRTRQMIERASSGTRAQLGSGSRSACTPTAPISDGGV